MSNNAYIVDSVRTARSKHGQTLRKIHPIDLGSIPLKALSKRNSFDLTEIESVIYGYVSHREEPNLVSAREVVFAADWPIEVSGLTVHQFCSSGLVACHAAAHTVMSGMADFCVGGGVEHRIHLPRDFIYPRIQGTQVAKRFSWVYPQVSPGLSAGLSSELIVSQYDFTRQDLDEYAFRSHQLSSQAWAEKRFEKSIIPVKVKEAEGKSSLFDHDDAYRDKTSLEKLSQLRPVFKEDGLLTAGNACHTVDAASALLFSSEQALKRYDLTPRARVVASSEVGSDPITMLLGGIPAIRKLLKKTQKKVSEIDLFEINESNAAIPLALMKDLDIDPQKVNVNGGAIALGHPTGATGAILLDTLLNELERQKMRFGIAVICAGYGMSAATLIERI